MVALVHSSLTNSQPVAVRPWSGGTPRRFGGLLAALQLWRQRIRERRALARLSARELADIGASSADVYRELATPFWRAQPPC